MIEKALRWALCQSFGKGKGATLHAALMSGALGKEIRNTDEEALASLLEHAGTAIKLARSMGR